MYVGYCCLYVVACCCLLMMLFEFVLCVCSLSTAVNVTSVVYCCYVLIGVVVNCVSVFLHYVLSVVC